MTHPYAPHAPASHSRQATHLAALTHKLSHHLALAISALRARGKGCAGEGECVSAYVLVLKCRGRLQANDAMPSPYASSTLPLLTPSTILLLPLLIVATLANADGTHARGAQPQASHALTPLSPPDPSREAPHLDKCGVCTECNVLQHTAAVSTAGEAI